MSVMVAGSLVLLIYNEVMLKESEIDPEISKFLIYWSHPPRSVDSRKGN